MSYCCWSTKEKGSFTECEMGQQLSILLFKISNTCLLYIYRKDSFLNTNDEIFISVGSATGSLRHSLHHHCEWGSRVFNIPTCPAAGPWFSRFGTYSGEWWYILSQRLYNNLILTVWFQAPCGVPRGMNHFQLSIYYVQYRKNGIYCLYIEIKPLLNYVRVERWWGLPVELLMTLKVASLLTFTSRTYFYLIDRHDEHLSRGFPGYSILFVLEPWNSPYLDTRTHTRYFSIWTG